MREAHGGRPRPRWSCPPRRTKPRAQSVDDALVIDGTTVGAACRAGANVELRAFGLEGQLRTGLSHLRGTSSAAYWVTKPTATTTELWRP